MVFVDEAHSFGFYGDRGVGICAAQGVTEQVGFIMTTLSKAMGSLGGVVAAREEHVALMKASSRAFIFQASTSPADMAAALAALRRLREDDSLRERLWDTTAYMRKRFTEAGYDLGTGDGPIVTPHFPDREMLFAIVSGMYERGIHTSAVTYPIVESGRGRLRFICSAAHSRVDVDRTLEALIAAERSATETLQAANEQGSETDEIQPEGSRLEAWAHTFALSLGAKVGNSRPTPSLAVLVESPNQVESIAIVLTDHGVQVGGRELAEATKAPSCTLRFTDSRAMSALNTSDVQRLLDCIIEGTCQLRGQVEPFIWLVARLTESRQALAA